MSITTNDHLLHFIAPSSQRSLTLGPQRYIMTRSHRNELPIRMPIDQNQLSVHPNVQKEKPEPRGKEPGDLIKTPWTLNGPSPKPCRECHNVGISCTVTRRSEQCSRCASLGYLCHSTDGDAWNAAISDLKIRHATTMCATMADDRNVTPQPNRKEKVPPVDVDSYTQPFLSFISENPTTFHAVETVCKRLASHGFTNLSERDSWNGKLSRGGKYCFTRNGSSVIAFVVGNNYESGNGASIIASHIDALTARVKPIPTLSTKAGYLQLGVAPYAGALNNTWWDRDLGIGGRVLVKDSTTGKIETRLVKLGWPIARIPTLAPHFGAAADLSHPNKETEMVPIIGLDDANPEDTTSTQPQNLKVLGGAGAFTATQPQRLVKAIAGEMDIQDYSSIINWELELFDTQPAQLGGLDKEFIFAGRVDDKLCSFAAIEALIASSLEAADSSTIKIVGCFDDEEIGSLLRQGAHSNLLPSALERICEAFSEKGCGVNCFSQMYANSFMISADVSHAVNPNFMGVYLENHAPRLNTGIAVQADPNGHTTTDSISTAFLQRVADKCDAKLQVFQIRNDSRSGGTVGPMLSSAMGMRAIDAGLPQLSMHSIRATIGSRDPGLGVQLFKGFFDHFEEVDAEFR